MKKAIKTLVTSVVVAVIWLLYAFAIRPVFLIVELAVAIFDFFADIIIFPVDFLKEEKMQQQKERK